jgi:Cu+-exporting ATPase
MAQVKDVVCGMMIDSETTQLKSEYKGATYYFCGPGCKTAFDKNPEKFLHEEGHEHGGHEHHGHGGH